MLFSAFHKSIWNPQTSLNLMKRICAIHLQLSTKEICLVLNKLALWCLCYVFGRSERSILVRDLEPNTKYEFAIRLHIDQLSSPWSPVVYQSTFPDGKPCLKLSNINIRLRSPVCIYSFAYVTMQPICYPWKPWNSNNNLSQVLELLRAFLKRRHAFSYAIFMWLCSFHSPHQPAPTLPPSNVKVTLIEEDTALVSWKPPDEPNVAVTHYTVLYASRHAWIAGEWRVLQREGEACGKR